MNYGLIEGQRNEDFVAGTLPYEVRNESGDWTPYLPPGEWQKNNYVDTMACVTFSALNSIETQYKLLTGQERNFSDRYTARMSGTTTEGNWLFRVADSIRRDGIIDETEWPAPLNYTWESYYDTPPMDVVDKARGFLAQFSVQYEWIDVTKESLLKHLKHAPIQVTIPGHAVLNFFNTQDVQKYFDSYAPFVKERTSPFVSAMKIVLSRKVPMLDVRQVPGSKEVWIVNQNRKTHVFNADALLAVASFQDIQPITQAQLDAIPDSGLELAAIEKE